MELKSLIPRALVGVLAMLSSFFSFSADYTMAAGTINLACGSTHNFYDTGGSGGNYANNLNVTETFTSATAGQCLSVTFNTYNTQNGSDFLNIYDGVNTSGTLLASLTGNAVAPITFTSSSGSLTFVFTSDGTVVRFGWTATIACVACPPPSYNLTAGTVNLPCGTTYNFYDSGGISGDYANNLNITETFTAATVGQCVTATINTFNSESNFDILRVYDGNSIGAPLIATLTGPGLALPQTFTSSTGSLTFSFISDGSIVAFGWTGTISCTSSCAPPPPPCSNCATATPISSLPFNGTYTTCGGCDDVQSGEGCTSFYLGGEDYLFTYTPVSTGPVNIELNGTAGSTGVFVTQGCPTSGGTCVGFAEDGAGDPGLYNLNLTAGITYFITVDTWPFPSCTPFTISIEDYIIDPTDVLIGNSTVSLCSGTFYDSGGEISTYQNNELYTFTICSDQSGQCVMMNFLSFETEAGLDVLTVYDGPNTASPIIGVYSGNVVPPTLTSTTGCLTFVFDTDGSVVYDGWEAEISCITCGGGPCSTNCNGGSAPLNDACSGAQNLGALPTPAPCPSGVGALYSLNTTNLCATGETPYISLNGCQPAGDMASPSADVWYTFTITAPILQVLINGGLQVPNIALYEGTTCLNMIPRGCAIGNAGVINTNFQGLAPGQYFLQVSGGSLIDQCDFTLGLRNHFDCQGCVIQSDLTTTPPPINGQYPPDTPVTFCYTVTSYNQTSANWMHGVVPSFGSGWNLSTLTTVAATPCTPGGTWAWYNSPVTSTATGSSYGPGFFYETAAGSGSGVIDGNPGNNFGDNNGANTCDWTFCWTISTVPELLCVQDANLNVSINTLGDGESGSWTSLACTQDPVSTMFAQLNCCPSPIVNSTNTSCPGEDDGGAIANAQGDSPWDYVWMDSGGNIIQTNNGINGSQTISGLVAGTYLVETTDASDCVASEVFTITAPPGPTITITPSAPTVCSGSPVTLTASGASTYTWSPGTYLNVTSGSTVVSTPIGNTTYTVTGYSGACSGTSSVTVTTTSPPSASIAYSAANYCANGAGVNPTITGTTGGTFSASPVGLSINTATGAIQPSLSSPGIYTVTYSIAASGGCPAFTTTATVRILEPIQIYVSGTNPSCPSICDGTATAVATGGLTPYTYSWTGSASSSSVITGLCGGTYTATVTDAAGCVSSCTPVIPSSCFQIQSVLVDACGIPEYSEEMVFFQVGPTPLNTSTLSVTWPTAANSWLNLCTNSGFIANVNATITGGGMLIPAPLNIPAGANVVLITSNANTNSSNLFTNITGPLYVLFQCSGNTQGHFGNYAGAANLRTLVMSFGGCTDQVSYYTNQLSSLDGATVLYTAGGVPTYVNNGCVVPNSIQNCDVVLTAPPFDVLLSPASASTCEGDPVVLSASGATTYTWSPTTNLSAATGATVTASPTTTTTYSVTGYTGTCSETESVTITVTPESSATINYIGSPYCTDITALQAPVLTGTLGGAFSSSPAGLTYNVLTGAISPWLSNPGTYTVTYSVPAIGACPAFSTTATVTISLAPAVPTLTPSNPCSGASTTFTAGNGTTFEFLINGISQGAPSSVSTFASGVLSAGDQVCVRSTPAIPFVMNGNINEPEWGAPLATSTGGPASSGFGPDNNIDALFMKNMGGKLYCAIAGDEHDGFDQANNNWILLFIDSKPGGFNNLAAWVNRTNVPPSTNGLLNLALSQNITFDVGFNADYILTMNQANSEAYFDLYDMAANVNTYLGSNISNPSQFGFVGNAGTGDLTKGFEFNIPLSIIGSPSTSLSCFAMMVNDPNAGVQTFLSNQFLTSANSAQGNFGNGAIDFNSQAPSPISFILSADCFEETCITVIPTVTPTFTPIAPICYGDAAPVLPTTSLNGVTGTWSPSVSNTTTNTYTFTPTSSQCTNTQAITVTVLPQTLTTPIYHD